MLRSPLLWGAALVLMSIFVTVASGDLSFFPFLLALVGGWCFGFAFVNATMRLTPTRNGVMLHIAGTVVMGAMLAFMAGFGGAFVKQAPEAVRGMIFVLQMAAIPAAGWIGLGLLSRVTYTVSHRDAQKRPPIVPREWTPEQSGDGSEVRFDAVEIRMRTLTLVMILIVVPVGLLASAVLITLGDVVTHFGAHLAIILIGVVFALPVYLLFTMIMRRRAVACVVAFADDEVSVTVGPSTTVIPIHELDFLRWRPRSDYARIEMRGAEVDLSLLAGFAKAPPGCSPELPDLPLRLCQRLERAGLVAKKTRSGEVVTFFRSGVRVGRSEHRRERS